MPSLKGKVDITASDDTVTFVLDGNEGTVELGRIGGGKRGILVLYDEKGHQAIGILPGELTIGKSALSNGQLRVTGGGVEGEDVEILGYRGQIRIGTGKIKLSASARTASINVGGWNTDGSIFVNNAAGKTTIRLDGKTGDISLAGADAAEEFELVDNELTDMAGTVMVIDGSGKLRISTDPYDRSVAGIVSGAGEYRPGVVFGRNQSSQNSVPISLIGRVFCKVDASDGQVVVGDLLTTSSRPGHAMKVRNHRRAQGAVVGKALGGLASGQDLVPVLVALQ